MGWGGNRGIEREGEGLAPLNDRLDPPMACAYQLLLKTQRYTIRTADSGCLYITTR